MVLAFQLLGGFCRGHCTVEKLGSDFSFHTYDFWVVYTLAKVKITTSNHKEIWTLKRQNYGKKYIQANRIAHNWKNTICCGSPKNWVRL